MAAMTLAAELQMIEDAISSILTNGQRVQVNNRIYEKADLEVLRKMRTDCLNRINSAATMGRTVAEF